MSRGNDRIPRQRDHQRERQLCEKRLALRELLAASAGKGTGQGSQGAAQGELRAEGEEPGHGGGAAWPSAQPRIGTVP